MRIFQNGEPKEGEVCIGLATTHMFKESLWEKKRLDEKTFSSGQLIPIPTGKKDEDVEPVDVEIRPGGHDQYLMYIPQKEYEEFKALHETA